MWGNLFSLIKYFFQCYLRLEAIYLHGANRLKIRLKI